ncbi:hypothetical protein CBS101457_006179 [Exobasidium rhododendri]|nr:hypothetical protein CBS101457_006179 [Exobasidium rhododendri]
MSNHSKMVNSTSAPMDSPSNVTQKKILICLLRMDLRVHDNPLFHFAHSDERGGSMGQDGTRKEGEDRSMSSSATHIVPLYVFDERELELGGLPGYQRDGPEARTKHFGFWKTGSFRARFLSESVYDLRSRLRELGSDLMIRFGRPEIVVDHLVQGFQAQGDTVEAVWLQKEMTSPEVRVEDEMAKRLEPLKVPISFVHGKTLIHPDDLPFGISDTPDVFTPFRKRVEALGKKMVRPCWNAPSKFKPFPIIPHTVDYAMDTTYEVDVDGLSSRLFEKQEKKDGQISYYDILGYLLKPLDDTSLSFQQNNSVLLQQRHPASAFPLRGGESSALERLSWYFIRGKSHDSSRWGRADPPPVARYKQTRNNLLGHAYSTKMSPFLTYGSISPRQIWEALDYHEKKFGEDQNTYWVRFELLWRDYFFFVAEKFGDLLYDRGGFEVATDPKQAEKKESDGWKTWSRSCGPEHDISRLIDGATGIPFIDANIFELRESGFMSNRGRQNVASFLAKDLGYDWRIGAEFFQSQLIDYDPTSNYGNWQYVAGVGNDPRASRQFNCIKQAKDYDSHGEYVKLWIPALRNLHPDYIHTPWLLDAEERRSYGLKSSLIDVTMDAYPEKPMLELESWRKHYNRKDGAGSKMYGNPQEKVKDGKVKRYKKSAVTAFSSSTRAGRQSADQQGYDSDVSFSIRRGGSPSTQPRNLRTPMSGYDSSNSGSDYRGVESAAPEKDGRRLLNQINAINFNNNSSRDDTVSNSNPANAFPALQTIAPTHGPVVKSSSMWSNAPTSSTSPSNSGLNTPPSSSSAHNNPATVKGSEHSIRFGKNGNHSPLRTSNQQRALAGNAASSLRNANPILRSESPVSKADQETSWRRGGS